jgi:predicted acyltransferase (DUF342 family)
MLPNARTVTGKEVVMHGTSITVSDLTVMPDAMLEIVGEVIVECNACINGDVVIRGRLVIKGTLDVYGKLHNNGDLTVAQKVIVHNMFVNARNCTMSSTFVLKGTLHNTGKITVDLNKMQVYGVIASKGTLIHS